MSYWTYLHTDACPHCGRSDAEVCIGNMTSNVSPMWRKALGGIGLKDLEGKSGFELIPILEAAIAHITDPANEAEYIAMNPPNGWGSHESATQYLKDILRECEGSPDYYFRVSC